MKHERDPAGRTAAPGERQLPSLLQSAQAHYRAGRLVKAEAECHEILQHSPDQSEALQVLGMIAIKTGRYEAAVQLIERVLNKNPEDPIPYFDLGNALERLQRDDEAIASYRKAAALNPAYADAHFNLGALFQKRGALDASATAYRSALAANPIDVDACANLANVLHLQGRLPDAITAVQAALRLAPRKAALHYNLANMYRDLGNVDGAVASYREALVLDSRYWPALQNLARVLTVQGDEAGMIDCYERIVALNPASAAAHCDLGDALSQLGRFDVALASYIRAVTLDAGELRYQGSFARCVRNVQFTEFDRPISELLVRAVSEPWARPADLMKTCCDLVGLMPGIRELMNRDLVKPVVPPATLAWFGEEGLAALGHADLLHAGMRNAPVCTLGLERVLTRLRTALLAEATNAMPSPLLDAEADPRLLTLFGALAEQCYINEYVFSSTGEEDALVQSLRESVAGALAEGDDIPVLSLLAVAAYGPLARVAGSERLLDRPWPDWMSALLQRQVAEPRDEASLRASVVRVTPIAAGVSQQVRQQYEENPYPRWIRATSAAEGAVSVDTHARRLFPYIPADGAVALPPVHGAVDVLVAGCGTGQEPIELARQIAGARVLAVDLSLASLAYAQRKTSELNLSNVEYAQADITLLGSLDRCFDFIESFGVLHHLADPVEGWRTLLSLLRPGGCMAVGLYSAQARVAIVTARDYIARQGYSATPADIRRARQDLMRATEPGLSETLASFRDFFTTSECRDLLFHVQEHRFTLPEVEQAIAELGVRFMGFLVPPSIRREYSRRFPDDREQTNLRHWAEFESEFPYTFLGMYGFWVQKPGATPAGYSAFAAPDRPASLH